MTIIRIAAVLLAVLSLSVPSYAASSRLNNPSYWIKKLKNPDKAVLSSEEITEFNRSILAQSGQMADVASMPDTVSEAVLWEWLNYEPMPPSFETRFGRQGGPIANEFYTALLYNMNLEGIMSVNAVRFGVVVERADIRAFPADWPVVKRPGGPDIFQYSSIYPAEPVALLHTSNDGEWGFFQTRFVRGWIRLGKVAFGHRNSIIPKGERFLVATGSKVKVYSGTDLSLRLPSVPMGTVLYIRGETDEAWEVSFPRKGDAGGLEWMSAYVRKGPHVNAGYLPYTKRNVIAQAFRMIGEDYGWGGRDGNRDCSQFIKDIFATMGIWLPRNSRQQAQAGVVKADIDGFYTREEVTGAIKLAEPATTLFATDGHIMLYIGSKGGNPHVVHQVGGFMEEGRLKTLNRVSVTGLNAGKGSKAGAFMDRIKTVSTITLPGYAKGYASGAGSERLDTNSKF